MHPAGDVSGDPSGGFDRRPTRPGERNYTKWDIASLWVSMVVNIPNYYLAGSLVAGGMSCLQGTATILIANSIVLFPIILTGHAGVKYGVPFPALARAAFGSRGAAIPAAARALVACGWFGIETVVGGQALSLLLPTAVPVELIQQRPWLGTSILDLACFFLFWFFQLLFLLKGMPGIKTMEKVSAPILVGLVAGLVGWAYFVAGGFGDMILQPSRLSPAELGRLFVPALTAGVGSWSSLSVNISDFTRFAKSQSNQVVGQVGLPFFTAAYALAGLAITSATETIYGHAVPNPVTLLAQISSSWPVAIFAMASVSLATITTNVPANVVAPATMLASFFPRTFTFRRGAFSTATLGLLIQPWRLFSSTQTYVQTWLVGISGILGAVGSIIIADYWVFRRTELDVAAMYSASPLSTYYYYKGYNLVGMAALMIGVAPVIPGFLQQVGLLKEIPDFFRILYDVSWFVSFFTSGLSYLLISKLSRTAASQSKSSQACLSLLH